MSPLHTDYYVVRGRRPSPVTSDRTLTPSRLFGTRRSLSLSRVDEGLSLSRGRSLLPPTAATRTRSHSSNDIYVGRSELHVAARMNDGREPEPGRLYPSSKLTRGGVPLYKHSGLATTSNASPYRPNRPTSVYTPTSMRPAGISALDRRLSRTPSPALETEPSSPLYTRKRRLSPQRSTNDQVGGSSDSSRKRVYTFRPNNIDRSSSPMTRVAGPSNPRVRIRETSPVMSLDQNRGRTSPPRRTHTSPPTATKRIAVGRTPFSRATSTASSFSPSKRVEGRPRPLSNTGDTHQTLETKRQQSLRTGNTESKSTTEKAKPLRLSTKPSSPVKRVRFADVENDTESDAESDPASDTESDTSPPSPVFIDRRRLQLNKRSSSASLQSQARSWSRNRPEPQAPVIRGDPVLRRRKIQGKPGWSRAEVVGSNRNRAPRVIAV